MRNAYPGLFKTFGHRLGAGLADELLDHWFPPKPSLVQQMAKDALHALIGAAPYIAEAFMRKATPDAPPATRPADGVGQAISVPSPPPCKVLGQFICPKCGGHTWGTLGFDENGTYERYCTNGLETAYPEYNPNTVKTPCQFRWKATEDHLYHAAPTADDFNRYGQETTCVPPRTDTATRTAYWPGDPAATSADDEAVQYATALEWRDETPPPIDVLRKDLAALRSVIGDIHKGETTFSVAAERLRESAYETERLLVAVGNRCEGDETPTDAAARIITKADAYIAAQAKKIRVLIEDNEFPVNSGEFTATLSPEIAAGWGMNPGRVAVVLNGGKWFVRSGSTLEPICWNQAYLLLEEVGHAAVVPWCQACRSYHVQPKDAVSGGRSQERVCAPGQKPSGEGSVGSVSEETR